MLRVILDLLRPALLASRSCGSGAAIVVAAAVLRIVPRDATADALPREASVAAGRPAMGSSTLLSARGSVDAAQVRNQNKGLRSA